MKRLLISAGTVLSAVLLSACGGSSPVDAVAAAVPSSSSGGNATIQGVQTPAQISVVSAK